MLSIDEILYAIKGRLIQGNKNIKVKGVSIDTRTIKKGDVFIAIKGENFDGHQFIKRAVLKGASAIVGAKTLSINKNIPFIKVNNTTKALGQLALFHRCKFDIPVIAITGSAGKTTTKEMIAAVLKSRLRVLKNEKSENNHIGVPLTLLKLQKKHQICILELGTNQFGDIRWLAQISQPSSAILTNIGESHLLKLRTPLGVLREKCELVKFLKGRGVIIWNKDDAYLRRKFNRKSSHRAISFGIHQNSDFRATNIEINTRVLNFKVKGKKYSLRSQARHNIYNALVAVCCGSIFNIDYNDIYNNLYMFKSVNGRQTTKRVGGIWIIDDTYNSNPVSFKSAIETLDLIQAGGRKILVCADMLELGKQSRQQHEHIGKILSHSSIDRVYTFGSQSRHIAKMLKTSEGKINTFHSKKISEINKSVLSYCQPGDVLLVKGSRAMHMEKVVEHMTKNFNGN